MNLHDRILSKCRVQGITAKGRPSAGRYNYQHAFQIPICIVTVRFRPVLFALPCQPASYVFASGRLPGWKPPIVYSFIDSLACSTIVQMSLSKVCFITDEKLEFLCFAQLCIMRLMSHNYSYYCLVCSGLTTCKR